MTASVEKAVTAGPVSLDGSSPEVVNNVWLYGDEDEVVIIDASHDAMAIAHAVGARPVKAIVCTHGHPDHIGAALELALEVDAPVLLHPADRALWDSVHDRAPDGDLTGGELITVAGSVLRVLHTPGWSPGGVCLVGDGVVFTGATLGLGGTAANGGSEADVPTLLSSIRERLLTLPRDLVVHPAHGDDTTLGAEAATYEAGLGGTSAGNEA